MTATVRAKKGRPTAVERPARPRKVAAGAPRSRTSGAIARPVEPYEPRPVPERPRGEWDRLVTEIRPCTRCHLWRTRTQTVIYRGSLTPRLVFVGEGPGEQEDRNGLPFVGAAGRRLDRMIARLGIPDGSYGVLNLFKCRPPGNIFDPVASAACRPFLERQLAFLQPEVVVTLGGQALKAFVPSAPTLTASEGRIFPWGPARIFAAAHPAATFRRTEWLERWRRDEERLRTLLPKWQISTAQLLSPAEK